MNVGILGSPSAGKTLKALHLIREELKAKPSLKLISTIQVNLSCRIIDLPKIIKVAMYEISNNVPPEKSFFWKALVLIDEIHYLINSRRAMSDLNIIITSLITQFGKVDGTLIYTSQLFESQVDKILRDLTDVILLMERIDENGNLVISHDRIMNKPVFFRTTGMIKTKGGADAIEFEQIEDLSDCYSLYHTRERVFLDRTQYLK